MPAARFLTGASRSALNTPDISTSVANPQTARREGGRPPFLRGRVWLHRRALDTKLAKGIPPSSSAQLSYVQVRGLALLEPLLTSGDSPLFHPNAEDALDRTVGRIRAALLLR